MHGLINQKYPRLIRLVIQNYKLKFKIFIYFSVPPDRPIIYDARRRDRTKLIEPYNEGSDVSLICEVSGGKILIQFSLSV